MDRLNQISKFLIYIKTNDDNIKIQKYAELYNKDNTLSYYFDIFNNQVVKKINNFKKTIGLDLGCWLGISSTIYSLFECRKIYAADFFSKEDILFLKYKNQLNLKTEIIYIQNSLDNIRLENSIKEKLDWIVLYDVLCNTEYSRIPELLMICKKLLNNKGLLFITDFHYGEKKVFNQKRNLYIKNEIGDGTKYKPNGVWFLARYHYIEKNYPDFTKDKIFNCAYDTVGFNFNEIDKYIEKGKKRTASYQDPAFFVDPSDRNKTGFSNLITTDIVTEALNNAGFHNKNIDLNLDDKNKVCRFFLHAYSEKTNNYNLKIIKNLISKGLPLKYKRMLDKFFVYAYK